MKLRNCILTTALRERQARTSMQPKCKSLACGVVDSTLLVHHPIDGATRESLHFHLCYCPATLQPHCFSNSLLLRQCRTLGISAPSVLPSFLSYPLIRYLAPSRRYINSPSTPFRPFRFKVSGEAGTVFRLVQRLQLTSHGSVTAPHTPGSS
jgi:hypothetical protein